MVLKKSLFLPRNLERNFPGYSSVLQHQHKQILCKLCFKTHVLLVMRSSYYYSLVHIARRQREDKCGLTDCKWSQCLKRAKVDDGFFHRKNFSMINDLLNDFWRVFNFISYFCEHTHTLLESLLIFASCQPCNFKLFSYTIDDNKKEGDMQKATNLIFHLFDNRILSAVYEQFKIDWIWCLCKVWKIIV